MFEQVDNVFDPVEFPYKTAVCWKYKKAPVYYLLIRRGDALEIHIQAKDRQAKRFVFEASKVVAREINERFPWAKMLMAPVKIKSVYTLCKKVGLDDLGVVDSPHHGKCRLMVVNYGQSS